jgi:hypothetical protein
MIVRAYLDQDIAEGERRRPKRRVLKLETAASRPSGVEWPVLIHDLSNAGLLLESDADLAVGSGFSVIFPNAAQAEARVVWSHGRLFGCEFAELLPQSAVAAALLKSPAQPAPPEPVTVAVEEPSADDAPALPLGKRLWIIIGLALAAWTLIVAFAVAVS